MRIRAWASRGQEAGRDLAQSMRAAGRRPGFSLAVVLTLALGIGATTAVFSVINGVMLRPLPYPQADRLHTLFERDSLGAVLQTPSYPTFLDWHEQSRVFDGLAYVRGTVLTLQGGDRSSLVLASFVSEEFFRTMGTAALRGRLFLDDDHRPGGGGVAVLSQGLWRRAFGADPAVIGRTISLANAPVTIVGVMPPAFGYPDWGPTGTDLWLPLSGLSAADYAALHQRGFHADSRVIARLKPDTPEGQAQVELDVIALRLATAYPETSARWTRVAIVSLMDATVGESARTRLYLLGGAVALVLLICCTNLANLYLAHGAARGEEFAVRAALGAGRARVFRQLLAETLGLTLLGGALGTLLAAWTTQLVRSGALGDVPRAADITLDVRVFAFALGLTVLTALLFAAILARRVAFPRLRHSLGDRTAAAGSSGRRGQLPGWVLSAQVGLTVVLLVGAALLAQGFWRLSQVDPGFESEGLVLTRVEPPSPTYDDPRAAQQLYERVVAAVGAIPGVEQAGLINHAPVGRAGLPSRAAIGRSPTGTTEDLSVLFQTVSQGYFALMKIPIIAGREFDAADLRGPEGPVIINETLARQWGGRSPLGERIDVLKAARTRADFGQPLVGIVIGVTRDVKHFGLDAPTPPTIYVPYSHNLWSSMTVVARTAGGPGSVLAAIDRAIRQVDPAIPLDGPGLGAGTMSDRLRSSYASQRTSAALVSSFGVVALLLAAVGIFGVMSYTVALETREIGIRMALGATPSHVLRAVAGRVARIAGAGLVVGVLAASGLTRLMTGLLFEITPTDPATYLFVGILLMAVAAAAGYLPARRAATVDPARTLRS